MAQRTSAAGASVSLLMIAIVYGASADICSCDTDLPAWSQSNADLYRNYPIHNATLYLDIPRLHSLLQQPGANPNAKAADGITPLHVAFLTTSDPYWHPYTERMYQAVAELMAKGADPNIPFPTQYASPGATPLFWAAHDGRLELVHMLVQDGQIHANVNAKITGPGGANSPGATPLHLAAQCDYRLSSDEGAAQVAAYLISKGANVTARTSDGQTPFDQTPGKPSNCRAMYSDASDCPQVCKVLLNAQQRPPSTQPSSAPPPPRTPGSPAPSPSPTPASPPASSPASSSPSPASSPASPSPPAPYPACCASPGHAPPSSPGSSPPPSQQPNLSMCCVHHRSG